MAQTGTSQGQSILARLWKRGSIKLLVSLTVLIAVFLVSLPIGIRLYLQKWLVENGADAAVIRKVRLNPFIGVVGLEGVDVQKDGKTVFGNSTIYLNIGLANLLGREAYLQRATLRDVIVDIEQYQDGSLRIGPFTITPSEAEPVDTPPEVAEKLEEKLPWLFKAREVDIDNVTVQFRHPELEVDLVVANALLEKFTTDPEDKTGALSLQATVNGAPVSLELPTLNIVPQVDLKGTVNIGQFRLDDLGRILGDYLGPFSGMASLEGEAAFFMAEGEGLRVEYDGHIGLADGDIGGKGWGGTKGTVKYNGAVSFSMDKDIVIDVDGDLKALQASFAMPDPVIDVKNSDIGISGKTRVTVAEEVIVDTSASLKLAPTAFAMDILKTSTGETSWDGTVKVETGTESKGLAVRVDGKLRAAKPAYSMEVNGALMEVANDLLSWEGQVAYIMGVGKQGKDQVQTNGTLIGEAITFSLPGTVQLHQQGLNVQGATDITLGNEIGVAYTGDISLDATKVETAGMTVGDKQLTWSGAAEYLLADASQKLTLDGDLKAAELAVDVQEADIHVRQQSLQAKPDLSLVLEASPSFKGSFGLGSTGLQVLTGDTPMLTLAEVVMSKAGDNGSGGLVIESLAFNQLEIPASEGVPVQVQIPSITLADIESPDLTSASVASLTVKEPEVMGKQDKRPLATLGQLDITKISYSPDKGFACNTVDLDSIYATFVRAKTTEKGNQAEPASGTAADPGPDSATESSSKENKTASGLPVQISQVNVTGASGFKFTDKSMAKTFMTEFAIDSLQVRDIDLNRPDHPFSFELKGTFDKYSPLNVTGKCAPLAVDLFVEHKATLQNYSMMHASPYVIEAIGTLFPEGRLDLTSTMKIAESEIDMQNHLVFKDLVAETVDENLAEQLDNQLPIPLSVALPMLRDSDGTIELNVPLHGKLSDINVGISDIVITALGTSITTAVTPYLAYTALGPAGALAFLGAQTIGKAMMATNLPSLEFEFGARELTEEHKEILDKVGKTIKKDKKASFTICAKVGLSELSTVDPDKKANQSSLKNEAIRQELFKLGEARSLAVKEYLLDNFRIKDDRLLICNPGIEFEPEAKPVVEFKQ